MKMASGVLCGWLLTACLLGAQEMDTVGSSAVQGARKAGEDGFLADEFQRVDPLRDGWETEAFHDEIKGRLKGLLKPLAEREGSIASAIATHCVPQFRATALRPSQLTSERLSGGFEVRRPAGPLPKEASPKAAQDALANWLMGFVPGDPVEFHLKIYRVVLQKNQGAALVMVDATGPGMDGSRLQQNATWSTQWLRASPEAAWKLASLSLSRFEEVVATSGKKLFADITEAVLAENEVWETQLRHGIDHWRMRLESVLDIEAGGINGIALGDANGDGLEDLFYTDSGGLPKRLFLHQADGTLVEATKEAGLDYLDRSRSALFVDFDNDGDQDLALALEDRVLILANDGRARFREAAELEATARVHGLAAADYDRDGLVDLYVCSYGRDLTSFGEEGVPLPWTDANNGAPNALFRNGDGLQFQNVTRTVGLGKNNTRFSFAASWEDFDRDGWIDLYVANDFGRNNLYRNVEGKFEDVAARARAEDLAPGMACSWGDINEDGWMDLYVSNMFSGAGNRIAWQEKYKEGSRSTVLAAHKRFARGNTLLLSNGQGGFQDISEGAGVTLGRWAWGNQLSDVNNDGYLDALVGNGFITGPEVDDL